ncbi:hypothetical protein B825_01249 [Acinetobacter baumannii ZWS1122]|nr:hypothetical protein B825_01249 [Acinetobacter baumannii ZWS1122]
MLNTPISKEVGVFFYIKKAIRKELFEELLKLK